MARLESVLTFWFPLPVDQLLLDSYDYKEQVIMRNLYERVEQFPMKTKMLTCDLLEQMVDIIEKAHDMT